MFWKIGGGLIALAAFFLTLNFVWKKGMEAGRLELSAQVSAASADAISAEAVGYARGVAEAKTVEVKHIEWRTQWLEPARETITKEITRYAQTLAGRAVCLDADGVRAANQDITTANTLAEPATTGSGAGAMPAAPTAPDGPSRHDDPRPSALMDRPSRDDPRGVREDTTIIDRDLAGMSGAEVTDFNQEGR